MSKLILIFGVISLTIGIAPPREAQLKTVELRFWQVQHEKCDYDVCTIIDREM